MISYCILSWNYNSTRIEFQANCTCDLLLSTHRKFPTKIGKHLQTTEIYPTKIEKQLGVSQLTEHSSELETPLLTSDYSYASMDSVVTAF